MYLNPATQKNLEYLEEYGFDEVKPREALLPVEILELGPWLGN